MATRGDVSAESREGRKRAAEEVAAVHEDDLEEEGVKPVVALEGSKHGDGSLYEPKVDMFHWLYRLQITSETSMEPMRLTLPTAACQPTSTSSCGRHVGGPMLQVFSVKLAKLPARAPASTAGPIKLYGFMAIRDLMDPRRNYVFNRSRDDPFVIPDRHSDPFVYLPGPKRGVNMQARVLFEYHVSMIQGDEDDLPVIDGVAVFSERTCIDEPVAHRVGGNGGDGGGAMDISWARLTGAMEATVEVQIQELQPWHGRGIDLTVTGFLPKITGGEEIKLFRGLVDKPCALNRFVIGVSFDSDLILRFRAPAADGGGCGSSSGHVGEFAFRAAAHGSVTDRRKFDFATVEVKVTWSALY